MPQERKAISVQCIVGQDDDLIDWYTSIEKGQRMHAVMRALRNGLGLEHPTDNDSVSLADVENAINEALNEHSRDFENYVQQQLAMLKANSWSSNGQQVVSMQDVENILNDDEIAKRRQNMRKGGW